MGIETKPTSFRLPDEALRQLDELQHAFAPAAKNRADCLTLLVALAHSAVIVRGKIATAIERMQSLLRSEFVAQTELEFPVHAGLGGRAMKPPVRVGLSSKEEPTGSRGRRRFSVSQRSAVGAVGGTDACYSSASPFLRFSFAYKYNARVA